MISKVNTAVLYGIDGISIEVETDISRGIPLFQIVGLAGASIVESRERVRAAIKNSGYDFPISRITANLVPANLKKEGSHLDLPISIGILKSNSTIERSTEDIAFFGELSLSGEVVKIEGALPLALSMKNKGIKKMIIPEGNKEEIEILTDSDIKFFPVKSLKEVVSFLNGEIQIEALELVSIQSIRTEFDVDFSQIKGQEFAKRAMEIAASGMHNIILNGPAGSGKTMIASRVPTILPDLKYDEMIEVTKVYSIAGLLKDNSAVKLRPFRSPHHTSTQIAITGGGVNPKPGEVSLANNGILLLDEFPEFSKQVIESLRQPIEDRVINISRQGVSIQFPCDFMLIATMNPCPCGNYGTESDCICTAAQLNRYKRKLSGPILDRIDIHIYVDRVKLSELKSNDKSEASEKIRKRVENAQSIQLDRLSKHGIAFNSQMSSDLVKNYCVLDTHSEEILDQAYMSLGLSARSYNKVLKLARTIADMDRSKNIKIDHLTEALQYRIK